MVKIGEVYWSAEVRGVGQAQAQADELNESFQGVTESAIGTAAAEETVAEETEQVADRMGEAENKTTFLDTAISILGSGLYFLAGQLGVATTATTVYSAATTYAATATTYFSGAVTTLYGVLAGPAGLAAGLFLVVTGLGLLGSEMLGLTNMTGMVQRTTSTWGTLFADLAFLIGGPIVGMLSAAFSAITGDWKAAKNKFINTSVEWAKAAARFAARVQLGLKATWIAIKTGAKATWAALEHTFKAGTNTLISTTNHLAEKIHDGIVGGFESAVNGALGVINSFIRRYNQKAKKVPGLGTIGTLGKVNFGTGGNNVGNIQRLQNEGLQSRLARIRRQGRRELARARQTAQRQIRRFAPDTIGGRRRTRTGLGRRAFLPGERPRGGGGGKQVQQNITVNIGDQSMNVKNMNRREMQKLAKLIGNELGSDTTNLTGAN